jgi:hypothetical protein
MTRTRVPDNEGSHDSDGSSTSHQDVLAQNRERERRVHGVAERVENGGDVDVKVGAMAPDVSCRDDNEFGESAIAVHTHTLGVRAELAAPSATVATPATHDVAFNTDQVTDIDAVHSWTDGFHVTGDLVSEDNRWCHHRLRRRVPGSNVQVRSADAGARHSDQDLATPRLGFWDIEKFQAWACGPLHQRFHIPASDD